MNPAAGPSEEWSPELKAQYTDELVKLKAQSVYQKEHAQADKAEIQQELDAIEELKQLKEFLKKKNAKKVIKHFVTTGLKLDNYIDNVQNFYDENPFFYDKSQMFWMWNKTEHRYERTDEIDMMNLIDAELGFGGQTVTGGIKNNYLEAFKRVGRQHIPTEPKKTWVQFKDTIVDVKTGETLQATPDYWIVNSIPWQLGKTGETPIIDKLFTDWQGDNKNILYEIASYCLLSDYPIHTIFTMIGSGANGKSQYFRLLENFVGIDNITSASLDRITSERFESSKLYKKLICMMGETNFTALNNTEQLKKLCSGTDAIDFEFKNKNPFTAHNYAKIIINTNSLPASNDTTDGFYRRWLILNWHNTFQEGKDIIDTVPEKEYEELAYKCVKILKELLERGQFSIQGNIEDRKKKYIMASNPISLFIQEKCEIGDSYYIKAKDLYHAYVNYLQEQKRRIVKRKEFNQLLAEEGYQAEHDKRKVERDGVVDWENSYWIDGLKLKVLDSSLPQFPLFPLDSHLVSPYGSNNIESQGKKGKIELDFPKIGENTSSTGNEGRVSSISFEELQNIMIDHPDGYPFYNAVKLGLTEEQIKDWIGEGLLFESPAGTLRLL